MDKPLVYVASPYTKGDVGMNVWFQCKTFDRLLSDGVVLPFVPLWTHMQHLAFPRHYADWIEFDNALILRLPFNACLRLNAEVPEVGYHQSASSGADAEEELFRSLNVPVFYSIEELYEWATP